MVQTRQRYNAEWTILQLKWNRLSHTRTLRIISQVAAKKLKILYQAVICRQQFYGCVHTLGGKGAFLRNAK